MLKQQFMKNTVVNNVYIDIHLIFIRRNNCLLFPYKFIYPTTLICLVVIIKVC